MRRFIALIFGSLTFSLLSTISFAQDLPDQAPVLPMKTEVERYVDEIGVSRNQPPVAPEARVLKKGLLAPSLSDRTAFAAFLQMPNTGLIRLLPREVYDSHTAHKKSPVSIPGGGAYYSFAAFTHVYGYGSDIELSQSWLSVGFAGADYGMLTMLGDVPLAEISDKDPRTKFLASYRPPSRESQARAEARRFSIRGGVTMDGLNYQRRQPAFENWSYLLRSISYDRTDVLVAFRVIRRDKDGSVIIAWKRLKQYPAPQLIQGK